jgi:hypothetical protein
MKTKGILLLLLLSAQLVLAQSVPPITLRYSKLLATYDFVQRLPDSAPANAFKTLFLTSKFNVSPYTDLIAQLDTLHLFESYSFQGYPAGQKVPVMTSSLIERNLINATSLGDFKQATYGLIPNSDLQKLSEILIAFEPVYDSLLYQPHSQAIQAQISALDSYMATCQVKGFFEQGLRFYGVEWDEDIGIYIALVPSITKAGFSARAYLNTAVVEVPLQARSYATLFSVLMHELYHNIYDAQSLERKLRIQSWFAGSSSAGSQYAYLYLNEVLATALGNGYVYETICGSADTSDWYNVPYIHRAARGIYPMVQEYLREGKVMDQQFVDRYVALYDGFFSDWKYELDYLMTHRMLLADHQDDLNFVLAQYPYASNSRSQTPLSAAGLEAMKETPFTKVLIVSSDHVQQWNRIQETFPGLEKAMLEPGREFVYWKELQDKTILIMVNRHTSSLEVLWKRYFSNGRLAP